MEYEFGGGIAGKLLGRAAEPIVRGNLQRSVETLKRNTEKLGVAKPARKQTQTGSAGHHKICNKGDVVVGEKHHKSCNKACCTLRIQGEKFVEKRLE